MRRLRGPSAAVDLELTEPELDELFWPWFERLSPWLDHKWRCAITRHLRAARDLGEYPACSCGFDDAVRPLFRARLRARGRGR